MPNTWLVYPETSKTPKRALLLLHGYGANNENLFSLAPFLQEALGEDSIVIVPNGLAVCERYPEGYQWYSVPTYDFDELTPFALPALEQAQQHIHLIQERFGIAPENIVLAGFSQGGMMALHLALNSPTPFTGVVVLSGYAMNWLHIDKRRKSDTNPGEIENMGGRIISE